MAGIGGELDGGRELALIEQQNPLLGRLLRNIIDSTNIVAKNAAVSATGENAAPHPPQSSTVSIASTGETAQFVITHHGPIQRGIRYFTEVFSDDPQAGNGPVSIIDHGTSRTSPPITLPSKRIDPNTHTAVAINYTAHSYAQYRSSQPSPVTPVRLSDTGATTFTMNGNTVHNMIPGQGSGTAINGQQQGQGLGKTQSRD